MRITQRNRLFVIQNPQASQLHYDSRLDIDGTLKAWPIPTGPSPNPSLQRHAVTVEEHPFDYAKFEAVIREGGYTPPKENRIQFGAILVGLYDGQRLRYAGKVGTGYSDEVLTNLGDKMRPLRILESPFELAPPVARANWIRPVLVAQIAFAEWTKEGRLRQPAFLGLRDDKKPSECRWRERDQ